MFLLAVAGAIGPGCVSSSRPAEESVGLSTVTRGGRQADPGSEMVAASSLVFAPPITLSEPPLNLDRASRQPGAFFGYDDGSVEYYSLTVDDRQVFGSDDNVGHRGGGGYGGYGGYGGGWSDRYERRAVSERVGAIRR